MRLLKRAKQHKGVRESLSNIGWLSGDRLIRMLGAVLIGTLVARYLGPEQFGFLNYGIAIYGLFNVISNLGLDSLVVRDLALDSTCEPVILGTAFVLKGLASVLTTVAAVIAARILDPNHRELVIIVALVSFASISQALDVIDFFFQAHTRSRFSVVPRNVAFVAASLARLFAVISHAGLLTFAWIAALEVLVAELGLTVTYFRYRRAWPRWRWDFGRARVLLSESWPLLVSGVTVMIYMRTDQVLLGKLGSVEAVGIYSAAIRFSEIWYAIPVIVTMSVMPRLLKSRDADPARYYARLQTFYETMILVSVAVTLGTLALGPIAIRLLYGPQYSSAAGILSIHIWTGIFVSIGSIGSQQYVHERITITTLRRSGISALLNVVLNILWIPRWGGVGSAMATLVAQSYAAYFGDAFDQRTRHIFRMKTKAGLRFWMLHRLLQDSP
jgi:polysaccharide transporter, PST family